VIPLYCLHTASHAVLYEQWFRATLPDEFDLRPVRCDESEGGSYRDPAWSRAVLAKLDLIERAIEDNPGAPLVYSDVDVQFFAPVRDRLLAGLGDLDIVCQCDDHRGRLCTGFFAARGSDRLAGLWRKVRAHAHQEGRDQRAFNALVREDGQIRAGALPAAFFGAGCGLEPGRDDAALPGNWTPGTPLTVPSDMVMHHANWTVGVDNKIAQLRYVAALRTETTSGGA
jgi:hypothetical protein